MADVARTAIVSKENLNGLLLDESVKNSPKGDPNELTECSASNHTNSRSNRNSCSSAIETKEGYQEIDSFSELSFKTTDEISLQDLIESEFAARISTMNGDDFSAKNADWGQNKSQDLFDDLFEEYDEKDEDLFSKGKPVSRGKDYIASVDCEMEDQSTTNLDAFISGPMHGDCSLITGCTEDEEADDVDRVINYKNGTKSVNIFKLDRPEDIPIMTNFDPFTAIEEDSESSNQLTNPNILNSPDEFPFPDSPQEEGKVQGGKAEEQRPNGELAGKEDLFVNSSKENVMREFFSKTVSDENLDNFAEQNYEENGGYAKFHVVNNMSSVESVNNSCPNVSNLTSPEKNEVDEFFSSEDIANSNSGRKTPGEKEVRNGEVRFEDSELKEISPPANPELFAEEEPFDEFDDFPCSDSLAENGKGTGGDLVSREKLVCNQEEWTTVEEALKAEPENFELEGDSNVLNVTNQCAKANVIAGEETNDVSGLTNSQINGLSDSESETISESKTTKKKKTKKGKKSEEKENISVDSTSRKGGKSSAPVSSAVVEDLGDLSNVSVKNLMLTYSSDAPKTFQNRWSGKDGEPGLLQNLKARSMVDLTSNSKKIDALRFNLFESAKNGVTSRSTSNLSNTERHPVVTGVSVRALTERYCSMINLVERTFSGQALPPKQRKKIRVPWSEALKSSFSKFDQLSKKTILHVRSVDATKVQKQFNEASTGSSEVTCNCKSCGKQVFQMEQIKAEKSVWHKNCFRCKECNKQLSVDTYSSHEGVLYCKPHFRELFKPKAVLEDETEPVRLKKPELIIRENQPVELPPEVVRASDKPDLGLDELASLNVKSRFQVFEKGEESPVESLEKSPSTVNVKRSPSILSKLAKFQKKGMNVGVRDDELNGLPIEQSSTSSEEEEESQEENESSKKVVKSKKVRERPMSFSKMGDVKSVWENGVPKTREEMREERNKEIHQIRSKLFMGKQVKMKEAYEQAVRESENVSPRKSKEIEVRSEKAKSIKECFEKGEPLNVDDEDETEEKKKVVEDDMSVFEAGISKKSRSLFLELDKSAKTQQTVSTVKKPSSVSPGTPSRSREPRLPGNVNLLMTPKCKALMKIFMYPHEQSSKFQKKCTFKGIGLWTNRRNNAKTKIGFYCEVSRQPSENIVRSSDAVEDVQIETADVSSKFKFFETYKEPEREKKKFRITPPREGQVKTESPEKEIYRDPNVVRACDKVENEIIRTNTTAKMLSLFRQMEEKTEEVPEGPKPLKRFTPPPDYKEESEGDSEEEEEESEEEEEETNPNIIRASDKVEDEYLKQAANAARAKQLRAKFEKWEEKEKEREREEERELKINGSTANTVTENSENIEVTSIECTKSLRARFESMKTESQQPKDKVSRPKVNRFVEIQNNMAEFCDVCTRRVYQLEKVETSGKIFHKTCFRCMQCNSLLRMESFTLNCGNLYCLPHFKQKFISKGNYDEGFGVDQRKAKWPTVTSF